jgi:hypothetical protein
MLGERHTAHHAAVVSSSYRGKRRLPSAEMPGWVRDVPQTAINPVSGGATVQTSYGQYP